MDLPAYLLKHLYTTILQDILFSNIAEFTLIFMKLHNNYINYNYLLEWLLMSQLC